MDSILSSVWGAAIDIFSEKRKVEIDSVYSYLNLEKIVEALQYGVERGSTITVYSADIDGALASKVLKIVLNEVGFRSINFVPIVRSENMGYRVYGEKYGKDSDTCVILMDGTFFYEKELSKIRGNKIIVDRYSSEEQLLGFKDGLYLSNKLKNNDSYIKNYSEENEKIRTIEENSISTSKCRLIHSVMRCVTGDSKRLYEYDIRQMIAASLIAVNANTVKEDHQWFMEALSILNIGRTELDILSSTINKYTWTVSKNSLIYSILPKLNRMIDLGDMKTVLDMIMYGGKGVKIEEKISVLSDIVESTRAVCGRKDGHKVIIRVKNDKYGSIFNFMIRIARNMHNQSGKTIVMYEVDNNVIKGVCIGAHMAGDYRYIFRKEGIEVVGRGSISMFHFISDSEQSLNRAYTNLNSLEVMDNSKALIGYRLSEYRLTCRHCIEDDSTLSDILKTKCIYIGNGRVSTKEQIEIYMPLTEVSTERTTENKEVYKLGIFELVGIGKLETSIVKLYPEVEGTISRLYVKNTEGFINNACKEGTDSG